MVGEAVWIKITVTKEYRKLRSVGDEKHRREQLEGREQAGETETRDKKYRVSQKSWSTFGSPL